MERPSPAATVVIVMPGDGGTHRYSMVEGPKGFSIARQVDGGAPVIADARAVAVALRALYDAHAPPKGGE